MKRFTSFLGVAVIAVAALSMGGPMARGGRWGGPASGVVTVPPYTSVYYDLLFLAGDWATVTTVGNGSTQLELYLYDGDGNVARGIGFRDQKTASMAVYRTGFFRVEVVNFSPVDSMFILSTN